MMASRPEICTCFCNIRRPMLHVGTSFSRDPDQARNWQGAASSCIKLDPSCTLPSFPKQVGRNRVVTSVILSPSGLELAAGDFVQPRLALQHPFAKEGRGSIGSICSLCSLWFVCSACSSYHCVSLPSIATCPWVSTNQWHVKTQQDSSGSTDFWDPKRALLLSAQSIEQKFSAVSVVLQEPCNPPLDGSIVSWLDSLKWLRFILDTRTGTWPVPYIPATRQGPLCLDLHTYLEYPRIWAQLNFAT